MDDEADSTMVGIILLVGLAVILAGALYVFLTRTNADAPPPRAIGLSTPTAAGGAVTYSISAAAPGAGWEHTRVMLHGATGAYTIAVTQSGTTNTASSTDWVGSTYYATRTDMVGGDSIRLTASAPQTGVRLLIADESASALLLDIPVNGLG